MQGMGVLQVLWSTYWLDGRLQYFLLLLIVSQYAIGPILFNYTITVVMILRVYAMWNRSKRVLYGLLFIFVPQVIVSLTFTAIYGSNNIYYLGMSWAGFHVPSLMVLCQYLFQPQLFKPSTSLFAFSALLQTRVHCYCQCTCMIRFCDLFSVPCSWSLLLPKARGRCFWRTKQPSSGTSIGTCKGLLQMGFSISSCRPSLSLLILFRSYCRVLLGMCASVSLLSSELSLR